MSQTQNIREGMQVYGANDQLLGTVERVQGDGFDVAGYHYSSEMVARVAKYRIYVRGTGMAAETARRETNQADRELHVPVAEERLSVGKRAVELGEVDIRKTVVEEEQTVPVTLRHEELRIQEVDIEDRPLRADDDAFNPGEITINLRGEEAVVAKKAFVTGEVVIEKGAVSEEHQITDTVRRQRVDVDEAYRQVRTGLEQAHTARAATTGRTFEQAEPHYRAGFAAAHHERHTGQEFEEAESDLRAQHTAGGNDEGVWEQLRQDIRAGWDKARGR